MAFIQRGNNDPRQPLQGRQPNGRYPLLGYGFELGTPDECRNETFWKMLTLICCPFFTFTSFIFGISIVQICIYIATVVYDYNTDAFLEPSDEALDDFGAKNPEKMQEDYEVWRWITPVFLHATLTHIVYNLILQFILGFRLEPTVKLWRTAAVYMGSGFGGVIFSCLVDPDTLAVGSSTAIFGMTGAMLAWIVMNWTALDGDYNRYITLIWLVLIIVISLFLGFIDDRIDNWGHFGGLITGFALGWALFEYIDPPTDSDKLWKIGMTAFLPFYVIGGLLLFYLVIET